MARSPVVAPKAVEVGSSTTLSASVASPTDVEEAVVVVRPVDVEELTATRAVAQSHGNWCLEPAAQGTVRLLAPQSRPEARLVVLLVVAAQKADLTSPSHPSSLQLVRGVVMHVLAVVFGEVAPQWPLPRKHWHLLPLRPAGITVGASPTGPAADRSPQAAPSADAFSQYFDGEPEAPPPC